MADLDTWLYAADLILQAGNKSVVLCERGVRSVAGKILDIGGIAELRRLTHLPVIAAPKDVSEHAEVIEALGRAAIAAGAHGILE